MSGLVVEERPVYRAPVDGARRYLTKHAAYVAWAKAIIFSHCECSGPQPGEGWDFPPEPPCALHDRLFSEEVVACDCMEETREGRRCFTCGYDAKPRFVTSNAYYLRVRDRLVRWLKWRDRCGGKP